MAFKKGLAAAILISAATAQATCFSVYKSDGTVIHESSTSPVDLSQQIGDTIAMKFGPGSSMTMSDHGVYCRDTSARVGKTNSLADAVRAEEEKTALVIKAPAAKEDAPKSQAVKAEASKAVVAKEDGATTVMVKQDGTTAAVETKQGTVLKVKAKAKDKEKEAQ